MKPPRHFPAHRFSGGLAEFFPPDDERSPWMLRLAILRDDVAHEMSTLGVKPDADVEQTWLSAYTIRKISITIGEVRNLYAQAVPTWLKRNPKSYTPEFYRIFEKMRADVDRGRAETQKIRDKLGAHVGEIKEAPDVIRAHGGIQCSAVIDLVNAANTSLRPVTINALLFVTPEAKTIPEVSEAQRKISDALIGALSPIIHMIDMLLHTFWVDVGVKIERADGTGGPLAVTFTGRELRDPSQPSTMRVAARRWPSGQPRRSKPASE